MGSIRTRITMAFAGAFMASLVLFALAMLLARRQTAMREVITRATTEVGQVMMLIERRSSLPDAVRIDPDSLVMRGWAIRCAASWRSSTTTC
jgi:hypothetical protein